MYLEVNVTFYLLGLSQSQESSQQMSVKSMINLAVIAAQSIWYIQIQQNLIHIFNKKNYWYLKKIVYWTCILFPEVVKQKGLEHITVDDLVSEITPKGRGQYVMMWVSLKRNVKYMLCNCYHITFFIFRVDSLPVSQLHRHGYFL